MLVGVAPYPPGVEETAMVSCVGTGNSHAALPTAVGHENASVREGEGGGG
jgi:hypothetical protein